MPRIEDAMERIKELECPTGEVERRLEGIFENYGFYNRNEITIKRDKKFDKDGAEAYSAKIPSEQGRSVVVLAKSGIDDYVAKVVDVYIS